MTWDHMSSSGYHVGCKRKDVQQTQHARPLMGRRIIMIIMIIIIISSSSSILLIIIITPPPVAIN